MSLRKRTSRLLRVLSGAIQAIGDDLGIGHSATEGRLQAFNDRHPAVREPESAVSFEGHIAILKRRGVDLPHESSHFHLALPGIREGLINRAPNDDIVPFDSDG